MMRIVADVLVAATTQEAAQIKRDHPQLRQHLVLTPRSRNRLRGCTVGTYTWTPAAQKLSASERMALKTALVPVLASDHQEIDLNELLQPAPLAW